MHHLVFIIHKGFIAYRMNDQQGSHPLGDDTAQSVIDYLKKMIKFKNIRNHQPLKTRLNFKHAGIIHTINHRIIYSNRFTPCPDLCHRSNLMVADTQLRIKN